MMASRWDFIASCFYTANWDHKLVEQGRVIQQNWQEEGVRSKGNGMMKGADVESFVRVAIQI